MHIRGTRLWGYEGIKNGVRRHVYSGYESINIRGVRVCISGV